MKFEPMISAAMAQFKQKMTDFCAAMDLESLTADLTEQVGAALQASLASAGVAGYRAFLLSHEQYADEVVFGSETFRFKQVREKSYLTPFGEMTLPRRCFQNKLDTKSHVPLDCAWGMEEQYMAPQVREAVLFCCAHVTPEETAQLLKKCALFRPHATAIKHVVEKTGDLVEAHRDALDEAVRAGEKAPEDTKALVVSIDGATVLLGEKGLRFGRPAERPRGDEPKETPTAYRIAMVGSVTHYGAAKEPGDSPTRLCSRYVAQMPEERCPTFKARLERELDDAESAAPPGVARILLLDGARELWNYLDKQPRFDDYHRCIDFFHAVEHLSVAAEALFTNCGNAAKNWYHKYMRLLLESDNAAHQIGRSMDYYEKRLGLSKTRRALLHEQRTYFKRNGARMCYATFRNNGWPIGSGPIEAACKTLVKTRLCRSGMRWSRIGGQRILTIRTYVKSNRWDSAWSHIKKLSQAA
jgi:hypothetical protein